MICIFYLVFEFDLLSILLVIFVGGFGMWLWLLLCEQYLKQLIELVLNELLLLVIVCCLNGIVNVLFGDMLLLVCGEQYCFMSVEQVYGCLVFVCILLEFVVWNIVFVLMLVVFDVSVFVDDFVFVVMLVDYVIVDDGVFQDVVVCVVCYVQEGVIVMFGVLLCCVEMGYGYIQVGELCFGCYGSQGGYVIGCFVEKFDVMFVECYL